MNVRKPTDYSAMYGILDQLMGAEFPQMELYFEIGKIVCAHPEKGTAVMAAEYLQANYPGDRGFSPRNLRRMREFYRAYADNSELRALVMNLGFSHQVTVEEIEGITIEVPSANKIVISGTDKQKVGQFAAEVREKRPPEPYKGKGIKYTDEVIRRKEGKTGVKKK